jgi:hypothetical protein
VVNNVSGVASSVVNDGNINGTSVIEATPFGSVSSELTVDNNGNAYFNGLVEVHGSIKANLVTAETGNDIGFHVGAGQKVVSTINGVDTFDVTSNGANLITGNLTLPHGAISAINFFTGTSVNGAATATHNLGVVPDGVILTFNLTVNPGAGHTLAVDMTTATATTITVRAEVAANFIGIAYKKT